MPSMAGPEPAGIGGLGLRGEEVPKDETVDGVLDPQSAAAERDRGQRLTAAAQTEQHFELALSHCDVTARQWLQSQGWELRDALGVSTDLDVYRGCIVSSRGEFTLAENRMSDFNIPDPVEAGRPFPHRLVLEPISRHPITLPASTVQAVLDAPVTSALPRCEPGDEPPKRASIVIVSFDNLVFTKLCLESVLANTHYPGYEVIVVDNGSSDDTPPYLRDVGRHHPHVRVIFNERNLGFAPAANQGLAAAVGSVLVLLNNDTLVPCGWLSRLVRHLENPAIGLVGPVTNRIGNEAQIEVSYRTYGQFLQFARAYTQAHDGKLFDIGTAAMFCVALRRTVYEQIGPLDERFRVGMLEDDDYAMRVRAAGYRVVCAEGVFVHHFDKASFGKLVPTGQYGNVIKANRRRFEAKWGIPWEPYRRRRSGHYRQLVDQFRAAVERVVPAGATIVIVSRGDEELLSLDGRRAWHFPQTNVNQYAGHYPAESTTAIAHLESLRAKGGQYFALPETAFWWLEHYKGFRQHVEARYRLVFADDTCRIFAL